MSQGFSSRDLDKPKSPAVLREQDKDFRALLLFYETNDEGKVGRAMGIPKDQARVRINRAQERYGADQEKVIERARTLHEGALMMMLTDLIEVWQEGGRSPDALLKVMERHAKLHALDAEKERAEGGGFAILTDLDTAMGLAGYEKKEKALEGEWEDVKELEEGERG